MINIVHAWNLMYENAHSFELLLFIVWYFGSWLWTPRDHVIMADIFMSSWMLSWPLVVVCLFAALYLHRWTHHMICISIGHLFRWGSFYHLASSLYLCAVITIDLFYCTFYLFTCLMSCSLSCWNRTSDRYQTALLHHSLSVHWELL